MPTTLQMTEQGTPVNLLTTELNSLASGSNSSAGPTVTNTITGGTADTGGYVRAKIELLLAAYSGTPTAGTAILLWFLKTVNGTDFEDGSSSVTPSRRPDVVIPVRNVASGPQRIVVEYWVPVGAFKTLARNDTIGVAFASSGNTIKALFNTDTGQ
jgi:hypothetical protein